MELDLDSESDSNRAASSALSSAPPASIPLPATIDFSATMAAPSASVVRVFNMSSFSATATAATFAR